MCVSVRACMCNIGVNLQRVPSFGHFVSLRGDVSDGEKQSFLAWGRAVSVDFSVPVIVLVTET